MSNPFASWTPEMVDAHNARMATARAACLSAHPVAVSRPPDAPEAKSPHPTQKTAPRARQRVKAPRPTSHLEWKFFKIWESVGGPMLERELKFHPKRRWRSDFAHLQSRTLIEVEGGVWNGRHTRPTGFMADAEKYLAAYLSGWQVVRLTAPQLTRDNILAIALRCGLATPPLTP